MYYQQQAILITSKTKHHENLHPFLDHFLSAVLTIQAQMNIQLANENAIMAMVDTKKAVKASKDMLSQKLVLICKKFDLPDDTKAVEGTLAFVVTPDGNIQSASILSGIGYGCDEEALRVVKAMPNWIPAQQAGNIITTKVVLPISFNLTGF
ncbi:MAG: TonB family protein [Saprospiraceae bacterium]|nr:TonB family protein [Saprospiraceae bacterium]